MDSVKVEDFLCGLGAWKMNCIVCTALEITNIHIRPVKHVWLLNMDILY